MQRMSITIDNAIKGELDQITPEGGRAAVRVYYAVRNNRVVFLLNGGNKSSQSTDLKKAKQMLTELE